MSKHFTYREQHVRRSWWYYVSAVSVRTLGEKQVNTNKRVFSCVQHLYRLCLEQYVLFNRERLCSCLPGFHMQGKAEEGLQHWPQLLYLLIRACYHYQTTQGSICKDKRLNSSYKLAQSNAIARSITCISWHLQYLTTPPANASLQSGHSSSLLDLPHRGLLWVRSHFHKAVQSLRTCVHT